jgi:D-alanine-D-alanine ligase
MLKKTIAVFFGGQSLEHDVSILTGLQVINALDSRKYDILPVYIDRDGTWYHGKELTERKNYNLSKGMKRRMKRVILPSGTKFNDRPFLKTIPNLFFVKSERIYFDVALPAFHGTKGEDGCIQGLFEFSGIPYCGPRVLSSPVLRNKSFAKEIFKSIGIPVLSGITIRRPDIGEVVDIKKLLKDTKIKFPVCVKPCNLGSSVGVSKAKDNKELYTALLDVFRIDNQALIEPFVENLVEYNIAVTKALDGKVRTSVIERPITQGEMLDFKNKYLGDGAKKGGAKKMAGTTSEGMASTVREINPKSLDKEQKKLITESAKKVFESVHICGTPRIDFYCNGKTGKIWMNEINTIPGSFAYYLWEASNPKVSFTELLDGLIEEACVENLKCNMSLDLVKFGASIFPNR